MARYTVSQTLDVGRTPPLAEHWVETSTKTACRCRDLAMARRIARLLNADAQAKASKRKAKVQGR